MDIKLSFKEFIETYKNPETTALARDVVPYVDSGMALEFYSYQLLLDDEKNAKTIIAGHPDYMEVGIDAYVDFMLDMLIAINEKRPC
jgi:hypothetical protein